MNDGRRGLGSSTSRRGEGDRRLQRVAGMAFEMLTKARRLLMRPLTELDGVLERDQRNIDALLLKGNLLELYFSSFREMHDEARRCQEVVLALSPNNASALTDIGDWYSVDGQYRRALKFYDSALRHLHRKIADRSSRPELEAAYVSKVTALRDWNRISDARQVAREGLRYCPGSTLLRAWSKRSGTRKSSADRNRTRPRNLRKP